MPVKEEYRELWWRGQKTYEKHGLLVHAKLYHDKRMLGISKDQIFLDHGVKRTDIEKSIDEGIEQWRAQFPKLRNMWEHYEYVLKHVIQFDESAKIRAAMKECKTDEEKIECFPEGIKPILALHLWQLRRLEQIRKKKAGEEVKADDKVDPRPPDIFKPPIDDGGETSNPFIEGIL